jgi:hypothetical protein
MSKRSIILIVGLLIAVIALATALDLLAPNLGRGLAWLTRLLGSPPNAGAAGPRRGGFDLLLARDLLPRAVRSLAGIAALAGYGLILRYLAPGRLGTLTRALIGTSSDLVRHALNGLALLLLSGAVILLAAISFAVAPLAPLLGLGLAVTMFTGAVAFAMAAGQRLRAGAGADEHSPTADLLAGLLVFCLIGLVPYAGVLALGVIGMIGLGAVAATRFGEADHAALGKLEY